jgi:ribulose-phosphate 3-epimerase
MIKIAPSILSADFSKLGEEISSISAADYLHFDVMDGVFVPNISIGLPVLKSVRKITDMQLDVHLMITCPIRFVRDFIEAGADILVLHSESDCDENTFKALETIKDSGIKAGLAIKPQTAAEDLSEYLHLLDIVMVMSVEPGFSGQDFMEPSLRKISELREMIQKQGCHCEIEVDGGINLETAKKCVAAGADVLVSGDYIFKAENRKKAILDLKNLYAQVRT